MRVRVAERVVEVTNDGQLAEGEADAERARGFGLQIVGELCSRFGWNARIDQPPGKGVIATLEFPAASPPVQAG